jgi:hypothetical protein
VKFGTILKIVLGLIVVGLVVGLFIAGYKWIAGIVAVFGGLTVTQVKEIDDKAEEAGRDAKQKVLDDDPDNVIASLSDDAKRRVDAAKRTGLDAGVTAGLDALHRGRGGSSIEGGNQGGARPGGPAGSTGGSS